MSHRLLFDKSVQIRQLDVVEQHGILLFRAGGDKGRDCNVHVFRLSELEGDRPPGGTSPAATTPSIDGLPPEDEDEQQRQLQQQQQEEEDEETEAVRLSARTRAHAKQRRLERTKGCHLYSLARAGGSHLRMVSWAIGGGSFVLGLVGKYDDERSRRIGTHFNWFNSNVD